MAIDLKKGNRINLAKEAPGMSKLLVRLNWAPQTRQGAEFDLDTSVFLTKLNTKGEPKLISDEHFVFYNNLKSPDGALIHSGDDKTGAEGEEITVDLALLDSQVEQIGFVVTIHEFAERGQNFGQVPRSSIELLDGVTGTSIAKYDLGDDFSNETAVEFGNLYKRGDGAWAFAAVGTGYAMGLDEFVRGYGGNV